MNYPNHRTPQPSNTPTIEHPNHRTPLSDHDASAVIALSVEYRMQSQILCEQSQTLRAVSRSLCDQARDARRRLDQLRARLGAQPERRE
jgi:hypothetical protein